jgi:probable rRNA maturation factor
LQAEGFSRPAEVSILLTTDEHIRQLNRDYRGKDRPTDVLSFQQLDEDWSVGSAEAQRDEPVVLGDVVISVETAARQAARGDRSLDDEMSLLVVHGILHLLGYDDETEEGAEEMRRHEQAVLSP